MTTVQTNVRVAPDDKPLIGAIAARLRRDKGFRDRLRALLAEDLDPVLEARIARLEAQVRQLLDGRGEGRARLNPDPSHHRDPISAG